MTGSHHIHTKKSTLFVVSKDKWDTKEGTDKSIKMHCMYSGMEKGTSPAEATSNSKKYQACSLSHC